MSISGDKKNIFTTIGAYTSFSKNEGKIPKSRNTYPSVNNKKDVIPFLIDTLKVTVGSEAIKLVVGELLTKFLDKTETSSKTILKKQFTDSNSDKQVSDDFKTTGYRVKASKIDVNKKFRTKITSPTYPLYRNDVNNSFENSMHDAVRLEPTEINYMNTIKVSYDKSTDDFIFKSSRSNYLTKDFVKDYIDNTSIINKKEIHTNVMNLLFGTVSKTENKTISEVTNELEIDKILSQIIEGSDSFDISQDDLDLLFKTGEDIVNGVSKHDLGCGIIDSSLSIEDLTDLISQISGSTDSFAVSSALENTLENNTNLDPDTYNENKQTIKDNFFKKIINSFVLALSKALTTAPQIRALIAIIGAFKGNLTLLDGKISDTLKNVKTFINCMINDLIKQVSEFIYKKVISLIKELIKPIIKAIGKEKITSYSKTIKSLAKPKPITSTPAALNTNYNDIEGVIGGFSELLGLSSIGPVSPVPVPLIIAGVPRRGGLSSIKIASRIIARKGEAGLPVGALPSGAVSPDEIMERIRIEEILKAIKEEAVISIAFNSGIAITATGANAGGPIQVVGATTIPFKGYGVIQ